MGLIVYECQRADHGHEIRQFGAAAQSLYDYFSGRDETALFIGNINIGEANLDGLIIKNDAVIIVEFKDYEGDLIARQNGDWTCNGKVIKGGNGGKSVYDQLRKNQRILRKTIAENNYLSEAQRSNIKGLVVLSKLKSYSDDFDRSNRAWVYVSDIGNIGKKMHEICSANFRDRNTGKECEVYISENDIFDFIRKLKIDESALVTDFTDSNIMPGDLFDAEKPHNGKHYSIATQLANKTKEVNDLRSQLQNLISELEKLKVCHQKEVNEKDLQINIQKTELLKVKTEKLEADKALLEVPSNTEKLSVHSDNNKTRSDERKKQEEKIIKEVAAITEDLKQSNKTNSSKEESSKSTPLSDTKSKKKRFGMKERILKDFNVPENSLDAEQIGLIEKELNKSMIITGCAGSGKSVIAMYKAQQIFENGGDVLMIAYTKSLNRYMQQGKDIALNSNRFYYHWEWMDAGKPSADYIIVDEIQDFSSDEIDEFINAAKKSFFFFGDTAQSIYKGMKHTITMKELSDKTGVKLSYLNSNYRLPKPVAKVTQEYVAEDANPYAEAIYQSKETELPHFVKCDNEDSQINAIINIIEKKKMINVGILVPHNEQVLSLLNSFTEREFCCEYKYNFGFNDNRNRDTLDYTSIYPKIMTYHSAKGLQFETVFLPFMEGASDKEQKKALYVAMTRTYRFLYVLYTGAILPPPLHKVPEHLYLKSL